MQPVVEVIPDATRESTPLPPVEETYPEDLGTRPFDIANFIRRHPAGKLQTLWQRLGIRGDARDTYVNFNHSSGYCETNIFEYNLDSDAEREVVLQIKEQVGQSYRYLVFKDSRQGESKFLGYIDVWAKYPPADPVVLMSDGRAWLIVQSTAATGSGLGAWIDSVYEVSNGRIRLVASYPAKVQQSGMLSFPSKEFIGTPVSCEVKGGQAILTVSYRVEYWGYLQRQVPIFTKQQKAVLVGSLKDGSTYVDATHSEITPFEFETIYNFDSMGADDFLKYNQAELHAIAVGNDSEKKMWLKEFLETCRNTRIKRKLSALLK